MISAPNVSNPDNLIVTEEFSGRWADLAEVKLPSAAAAFVHSNLDALRAVWAHANNPRETLIAAHARREPGLVADLLELGLAVSEGVDGDDIEEPTNSREADPGRIWLLTSGSTGRPKRVAHTLDSLLTVKTEQAPRVWLNPYTPGAYAWWQVVTLGLSHPDQTIVCVDPTQPWAAIAAEHNVDAASGTPTFWRQALMTQGEALSQVKFGQITLGGEPVDQQVIDQLRATFPEARISWIYASSEAGASIAVHDGLAGFPQTWLDRSDPSRPLLSVVDDELIISSPNRGEGVPEQLHTGDRVEIRDGRVYIMGRLGSDEINVGGSKVSASRVRDVLLSHPGVRWAAVKARKAPVVGSVVQAEVVLAEDGPSEDELSRYCRDHLAEVEVPRRFRVLSEIPIKESLKSDV